ncbi:DUF904 domain-containing protein [Pseudoalteromonas sp. SSM20]|uniref:DUF904 domain-containing protein n=1 Tax=Pseudoalteromonas sp. SSM20 TaxID=3139394 RepID=UPI003BA8839C
MSDNLYSTLHTLVDQLISQNQSLKQEKINLEQALAKTKDELETTQLELMELEESANSQHASLNELVSKLNQAAS